MKFLPILLVLLFCRCGSEETAVVPSDLTALTVIDAAYGPDPEQRMDLYLPANRNAQTPTVFLVHGGGWSQGSRADMSYAVPLLQTILPHAAIANIDYRLGTPQSSGFPKQIEDIQAAVSHLLQSDYGVGNRIAFVGASAGAHLSLLYSYKYDEPGRVQAVCSIVGPTDFSDPAYTDNPLFQYGLTALLGNVTYSQNPELFHEVSPALSVTPASPPTILFYGGQDPLIPVSQATRLKQQLDNHGVYNEYYLYPQGGHGNWNATVTADFVGKLAAFFNQFL